MTSTEYIISSIHTLVETFPKIKCSHVYQDQYSTHYIEIVPKCEFDENEPLSDRLDEIFFEFEDLFPEESIAFSSEDAIYRLENPTYVLSGSEYQTVECVVWDSIERILEITPEVEVIETPIDLFAFDNEFSIAA